RGVMWVGTASGLYCFRPERLTADTAAYERVLSAADLQYSVVSCLYEDGSHRLWVGTQGGGAWAIDGESHKVVCQLTTAKGLISDEVQSIIEDGAGVVWLATKKGITCYDPQTQAVSYHTDDYHLMRNYYADNCACRLPDGRLAFGTNAGIVVYSPSRLSGEGDGIARHRRSSLAITDLLVNGESVAMADGEVTLAHDQNTLTVRFSTFNFRSATATRYTYLLEGYDKQWSELSAYSFANYKNLPPGRYTLYVKAYDNNLTDTAQQTLAITIRHPWWQTWWAYLIYIVLAAAIGYAIYRQLRTVYSLRRRISIERELTEYKLVFFTNISHEFRTPLTIIRGAMERIRSAGQVPAELRQPLSSMGKSVDRMLRLINQLLEFRKMQNGKLRLALEDTDIVAFVKDIYLDFNDMADAKRISYTFLPNVKSYVMPIDRQHVDKIVYNMLSNAMKYTPSKGSVSVRLHVEEPLLTIRVEDTGVGIPPEKQAQLFQRFMQSSFSNDSIGIGLHLTKALVDVHHGTIGYAAGEGGVGSVFTVQLPTSRDVYAAEDFLQHSALHSQQQEAATPAVQTYQEVAADPLNDRHVLVVEDDADVADFLKQLLGRYFVVDTAADGKAALEMIGDGETPPPDLVVSDIMMPVMNGYELTKQLRANQRTAAVPVILLTALDSDNTRLKGIERGADAYITKPFDPKLLVSTCRQLLERHDRMRHAVAEQSAPSVIAPPEIIVEERDKQLLDVMNTWLYNHISDPMLSVDELAESMGYGRSVFYRKVKALTGQTPADYIRMMRMNRAAEMLREETITVAEVCYKVGISDPHYFGKVFKQQFGISPKKYQQGEKASATSRSTT
ncbi:MAG: response regulator, partial [Prevotella sp.]|nr:response regulator [Prevotella sp.]